MRISTMAISGGCAALLVMLIAPVAAATGSSPLFVSHAEKLVIGSDVIAREPGQDVILQAPIIIVLRDAIVQAGDGADAPTLRGRGSIHAPTGGDGGDIILEASTVLVDGKLIAGDGGAGGDAVAVDDPAVARGGDGGRGGRIIGYQGPNAHGGRAGDGGNATARGADGTCSSLRGHDAEARGGSKSGLAGDGEDANATAGFGGRACVPGETGGEGGWAYAYAGDAGSTGDRPGKPGDAFAFGGVGGEGGEACTSNTAGGAGGRGGDAFAWGGNMTLGAYRDGSGVTGGFASAIGGQGGTGALGAPGGMGGPGGFGHAWGGNVAAVSVAGSGSGGGGATIINGGVGGGGPGCTGSMRFIPLTSGAAMFIGVLAAMVATRRRER